MLLKSGLFLTLCLFTLQASRIKGKRVIFYFWGESVIAFVVWIKRCSPQWLRVKVRKGAAKAFEDCLKGEVNSVRRPFAALSPAALHDRRSEQVVKRHDWLLFFFFFLMFFVNKRKKKRHPSADPILDIVYQPPRRPL